MLRRAADQVKRQRTNADSKVLAPPRITEESLRAFCTPTSFEEGRRDFMAGCVSPVVYASDGTLCASVFSLRSLVRVASDVSLTFSSHRRLQSDRAMAHSVTVSFDQDHILGGKCSCAMQGHFFRFSFWYTARV